MFRKNLWKEYVINRKLSGSRMSTPFKKGTDLVFWVGSELRLTLFPSDRDEERVQSLQEFPRGPSPRSEAG